MDEYDEFGNYIGPELASRSDDGFQEEFGDPVAHLPEKAQDQYEKQSRVTSYQFSAGDEMQVEAGVMILHEEKQYYPSAKQVYGDQVETLVQEEDTQPLSEPIIAPIEVATFLLQEKRLPSLTYKPEFLIDLSNHPQFIRNIALVGHLHHGKTSFADNLIAQTHSDVNIAFGDTSIDRSASRYLDCHLMERERGISIKAHPISLVLPDLKGKSFLMNLIDTPGHVDFIDEVCASLRISDGAVVVIDAVDGIMLNTAIVIKKLVQDDIKFVILINKIDRLILELKIPPVDAYHKLRHTIEEVNTLISSFCINWEDKRISPELGNVCFASSKFNFSFTLESFSKIYAESWGEPFDYHEFAKRLWGDIYFHHEKKIFAKKPFNGDIPSERTFVAFILNPLYKIFAYAMAEDGDSLRPLLSKLGIHTKLPHTLDVDPPQLLCSILEELFYDHGGFVFMCAAHLPSPVDNACKLIQRTYPGPLNEPVGIALSKCDPDGPLVVQVAKLFTDESGSNFGAFGRVLSGTIKSNSKVKILGQNYSLGDEEDMTARHILGLSIYQTRYRIDIQEMKAGNWVLIDGIEDSITKTATVVGFDYDVYSLRHLRFPSEAVFKIAIEPMNPTELPKMLDGLRKINKTYPLLCTKVEESGEHILLGSGELYIDCALHDLRKLFSGIDIRVSDPVVKFCETVVETSSLKCYAETPNKKNKLTMIAEPLEKKIAQDIESRLLDIRGPQKEIQSTFQTKYGWDLLASKGVWAFGPDIYGPNILVDDTLASEVDKKLLFSVKDSIKQGFQWSTREGPLCDEMIRNVKFRLLDAAIASEPIYRGGGQVIPTARRVCYSSFLTATPRLMEPVYFVEIESPADCISAIYTVLARRRGHVTQDLPKAGSPLNLLKAYLPVMDSFGFETDLRVHTQGLAFCQQVFDHWQMVPGDPLDKSIALRPLEPSPAQFLARDFMLKTRRRKGLGEDVALGKFFDDPNILALAGSSMIL